jgi:hypothetical protein
MTYFDVLEIQPTYDVKIIKTAYRKMVIKYHPDRGGSEKDFIRVKNAYEYIISGINSGKDFDFTFNSNNTKSEYTEPVYTDKNYSKSYENAKERFKWKWNTEFDVEYDGENTVCFGFKHFDMTGNFDETIYMYGFKTTTVNYDTFNNSFNAGNIYTIIEVPKKYIYADGCFDKERITLNCDELTIIKLDNLFNDDIEMLMRSKLYIYADSTSKYVGNKSFNGGIIFNDTIKMVVNPEKDLTRIEVKRTSINLHFNIDSYILVIGRDASNKILRIAYHIKKNLVVEMDTNDVNPDIITEYRAIRFDSDYIILKLPLPKNNKNIYKCSFELGNLKLNLNIPCNTNVYEVDINTTKSNILAGFGRKFKKIRFELVNN